MHCFLHGMLGSKLWSSCLRGSALTHLAIPSASPSIFPSLLHYLWSSGCRLLWCSIWTCRCPLSLMPPRTIILGGKDTETQCPAMWLTMCQVQPSTDSVYLVSEDKPWTSVCSFHVSTSSTIAMTVERPSWQGSYLPPTVVKSYLSGLFCCCHKAKLPRLHLIKAFLTPSCPAEWDGSLRKLSSSVGRMLSSSWWSEISKPGPVETVQVPHICFDGKRLLH